MDSATRTRTEVLAEHESLRVLCREVLERAARAEAGEVSARLELVGGLRSLVEAVRTNISQENLGLRPLLALTDAWGPERVRRLDASHEHQGDAAATAELDAGGTIDGVALAAVTRHFVREVVRTLRWETRDLLDPEFLRDELVSIEQGS